MKGLRSLGRLLVEGPDSGSFEERDYEVDEGVPHPFEAFVA